MFKNLKTKTFIFIVGGLLFVIYTYILNTYAYRGSLFLYGFESLVALFWGVMMLFCGCKEIRLNKKTLKMDVFVILFAISFIIFICFNFVAIGKDLIEGPQENYLYDCKLTKKQKMSLFSFPKYHLSGYCSRDNDFRYYKIDKETYEIYKGNFDFSAKIKEWKNTGIIINFELIGKNYSNPLENLAEYEEK